MRSVRCDACGARAMTAAAKCPKCSHLLDLRDGFGELLPLAYCSSCDSYYPEQLGECKWCHTKPDRPPIDAKIWRGVGAGLAAVLGGVWLISNLTSSDTKRPRARQSVPGVARKQVADTSADTNVDTVKPLTPTAAVASASEDSAARMISSRVAESPSRPAAESPSRPVAELPQAVAPAPNPASEMVIPQSAAVMPRSVQSNGNVSAARRGAASHWVRSVSRDWVIIRHGASKSSKIVASIGPNSRVELGESRGTWRRLRTKGVAGWVEPRNLFDVARAR